MWLQRYDIVTYHLACFCQHIYAKSKADFSMLALRVVTHWLGAYRSQIIGSFTSQTNTGPIISY